MADGFIGGSIVFYELKKINPRHIDIYLRGWSTPVLKDRHGSLSQQFTATIGNDNPVAWLSRETWPHIRQEALLPYLKKQLTESGFMTPDYLAGLDRRMSRVADTIAFLTAWQIDDCTQLFCQPVVGAGSGFGDVNNRDQ